MTVITERACEHCGGSFLPRRATARFCSDAHRAAHSRQGRGVSVPNANADANRMQRPIAAAPKGWPYAWRPEPASSAEPVPAGLDDECGQPLYWEQSGTMLVCLDPNCPEPVFPPALISAGAVGSDLRRQPTPDEQFDARVELGGRAEQLLVWIDKHIAEESLEPQTRGQLRVYRTAIKDARDEQDVITLAKLTKKLSELPIRYRTEPRPVVQGQVISSRESVHGEYEESHHGEFAELGRQALDSWANPTELPVTARPLMALSSGHRQLTAVRRAAPAASWCDNCASKQLRGADGLYGVAVVQVELGGSPGLASINHTLQPHLCQRCWDWFEATQPAGSYRARNIGGPAPARAVDVTELGIGA